MIICRALVSNNCEPFQYQEFVEELPSKKVMMQTYLQIKCAISKFEHLYCNKLPLLTFRQCANICLLRSIHHILKILFLQPRNKWLTLNAIQESRGQSQSKLWFHERRGRLTASCTFWYSNEMKRKCFPHITS